MTRRNKKQAQVFVIMPFKSTGTPEYIHFKSIYDDYIKPTVQGVNGVVLRGDEISSPGSINIDLIEHLASDDIVIADLTDGNPNVFYELGIRHSLVSSGTILIIDESKTLEIPFDLSSYRVIKYRSDPQGLSTLKKELGKYLKQLTTSRGKKNSDNPIHDWLGKKAPKVNIRNNNVNGKESILAGGIINDIDNIISEALEEAASDMTPKKILERADIAVLDDDLPGFLKCVQTFTRLNTFLPSDSEFREMYYLATRIDAGSKVCQAILKLGMNLFPDSSLLVSPHVSYLAHSVSSEDRQEAKNFVEKFLNIKRKDNTVKITDINTLGRNTSLLSLMLDAYHRDREHQQAYDITSSLVEQFPMNTIALRNHARAMDKLGTFSSEEVLNAYKEAVTVKLPGDYSALWYGATLSEMGRHVDCLEAHVYACTLDLDEPECFSRLANTLSDVVQPRNLWRVSEEDREIPDFLDNEHVVECILLAMSCPGYGANQKSRVEQAMRNIGFGVEDLEDRLEDSGELTRTDRRNFVEPLYTKLKSSITENG